MVFNDIRAEDESTIANKAKKYLKIKKQKVLE